MNVGKALLQSQVAYSAPCHTTKSSKIDIT